MPETPAERPLTEVERAVLYALRVGCFFPVPFPRPPYSVQKLTRWGAMMNMHNKIARYLPKEK